MLEAVKGSPDAAVDTLIRTVGQRVQAARKAARMPRRELSERSGVSPRYLAQLEGGGGNISIGLLKRIALALDVSLEALVCDDDPATTEALELATLYCSADTSTRARVRAVLDVDGSDKAQRICLIGLRGAGKSTLGARVAKDLGMPFVELNREIETRAGIPLAEIIALYGEEGYRRLETECLEQIAQDHGRLVLAVGGGIVASEATFASVLSRFHTVWIKADPSEHMDRVRAQGDLRPMAGNPEAMSQLRQILSSREAHYARADYQLDTTKETVDVSVAKLRALLGAFVEDPR